MNRKELFVWLKTAASDIDRIMENDLAGVKSPLLTEVLQHALLSGGKRVRPILAVMAARLVKQRHGKELSKENEADLFLLAITLEYLHAASLLHDDVIDRADQRRGKESANLIWGNSAVILAGDYLHARALTLAGALGGRACVEAIGGATGAMVEAEFLQMRTAEERNLSKDNYFDILSGKTAALIAAACEVGVEFSGGSKDEKEVLRTYGENLGLAFQIVDDLLDYQGDPEKTGKAVGNDLAEGKMTLPLIFALENCKPHEKEYLENLLAAERRARVEQFERVRNIIDKNKGFAKARQQAEDLIFTAVSRLEIFGESLEKNTLISLARYVLERDH